VPTKLVHTASSLVIYDAYGSIGDSGAGGGGSGPQNQPPVASFSYSPSLPPMGQSITFDASASSDSDGSITTYEWDWTNDGSYDATTSATATHSYSSPGSYDVKLRVTDDDGEESTTSETVVVIGPLVYLNDAIALDIDNDGTPSGVQFNVRNYGDVDLTVVSINVTPENATVGGLNDPEWGVGQWESEFYVENGVDEYTADFGNGEVLPYTFDLSEASNSNDEPVLAADSNATFSLYQFTDGDHVGSGSGTGINIAGESVDITLTMSDGSSYSFTIKPSGLPQADAGSDFTIDEGTTGALDGSGSSDPEGNIVTYEWAITDNPGGASVGITDADNTDPTATFDASSADVDGDQVVEVTLTVTDDDGFTDSDVVDVTVNDLDVPLLPTPVSLWSFNDSNANDDIDGNDGILDGNGNAQWSNGVAGKAYYNNQNQYIVIPYNNSLDLTTEGSVEAWVFVQNFKDFAGIVHKGELEFSDESYTLQFGGGNGAYGNNKQILFGLNDGEHFTLSNSELDKKTWYHVIGTWNSTSLNIYIDGNLDNSTTGSGISADPSTGSLQIGAQLSDGSYGFDGELDEVAIYDYALNATEVQNRYNLYS
jgi:hypothetical protein